MIDPARTYLARYESHLLQELREAKGALRQAERRVLELDAEIAGVRHALASRPLLAEAVQPTERAEASSG